MTKVSLTFKAALKTNNEPAYRIAQKAKVNPNTLSRLINGIEPVRLGDERIKRVAAILGMNAEDAFEISQVDQ